MHEESCYLSINRFASITESGIQKVNISLCLIEISAFNKSVQSGKQPQSSVTDLA